MHMVTTWTLFKHQIDNTKSLADITNQALEPSSTQPINPSLHGNSASGTSRVPSTQVVPRRKSRETPAQRIALSHERFS